MDVRPEQAGPAVPPPLSAWHFVERLPLFPTWLLWQGAQVPGVMLAGLFGGASLNWAVTHPASVGALLLAPTLALVVVRGSLPTLAPRNMYWAAAGGWLAILLGVGVAVGAPAGWGLLALAWTWGCAFLARNIVIAYQFCGDWIWPVPLLGEIDNRLYQPRPVPERVLAMLPTIASAPADSAGLAEDWRLLGLEPNSDATTLEAAYAQRKNELSASRDTLGMQSYLEQAQLLAGAYERCTACLNAPPSLTVPTAEALWAEAERTGELKARVHAFVALLFEDPRKFVREANRKPLAAATAWQAATQERPPHFGALARHRDDRFARPPILNVSVETLAGSKCGFADDAGAEARFVRPTGVAVDAAGNVYVADNWDGFIRKISVD